MYQNPCLNSVIIFTCCFVFLTDKLRKNDHLLVKLPASLGARVAWTTGDWNPHHLWAWSARLLGYRQPIAHGMWTMARSLCHLDTSGAFSILHHIDHLDA